MTERTPHDYKNSIQASGKDIYTPIEIGDDDYWIPAHHLEALLNQGLKDLDLSGLALRTRSKVVKSAVCEALGYPVPKSFKKTQPRFFGQQLDIYTQKALNLQIWNEELSPTRRYAIIRISENDTVSAVKVVNGQELALLDKTGTLTSKYQARLERCTKTHELISSSDTDQIVSHIAPGVEFPAYISPIDEPVSGTLLPIEEIFTRLTPLVGKSFKDPGRDQERNRGAELHRLICKRLGYSRYEDKGQFPDILHQLLEVKLQTSPTIDLGLILPNSEERLDIRPLGGYHSRHCDTRYAMFYAETDGSVVTLTHLYLTTGQDFFSRFRRFEGKVKNAKIQIPLPRTLFED